jgi:hypothetical protein
MTDKTMNLENHLAIRNVANDLLHNGDDHV